MAKDACESCGICLEGLVGGSAAQPTTLGTFFMYNHPEVDRITRICCGSFKDHILATPGWLHERSSLKFLF